MFEINIMSETHFFSAQKISPDSKEKVQLQLVLHDGGANTFHFINPKGRAAAIADRDGVKDLLQQLIPKFRRKLSSELEEKNRCVKISFNYWIYWYTPQTPVCELLMESSNKYSDIYKRVEKQLFLL